MEDEKRDSQATATPNKRRRPQPSVLDLKATEVAADTAAKAQEAEQGAADAIPPPTSDPIGVVISDDGGPAVPLAEEISPQPAEAPQSRHWPIIAISAAAGAATGGLVALAAVWIMSPTVPRDTRAADGTPRLERLEAQLQEFAGRPAAPSQAAVNEVSARAAAGEQALQQLQELQAKLAQAEAALVRLQSIAANPELGTRVAAIETATKGLAGSLEELRRRLEETGAAARAAHDAAMRAAGSSSAAAATAAGDIDSLNRRLSALETQVKTLEREAAIGTGTERDREARLASAALALRGAVERGEPFAAELAAVKALMRDPARLAPLDGFAADGLPRPEALARELSGLLAGTRRSKEPDTEGGGMLHRLQQSAGKLVRIRPAGEPVTTPAPPATAELEAKAARGDVVGALSEAAKLPEPQRAPLEPWIKKAQARIAALEVARAVSRESLAALAASKAEPVSR